MPSAVLSRLLAWRVREELPAGILVPDMVTPELCGLFVERLITSVLAVLPLLITPPASGPDSPSNPDCPADGFCLHAWPFPHPAYRATRWKSLPRSFQNTGLDWAQSRAELQAS